MIRRRFKSQDEVAGDLRIASNTLSQYIHGKREPSYFTVKRLADYLNVKVTDLYYTPITDENAVYMDEYDSLDILNPLKNNKLKNDSRANYIAHNIITRLILKKIHRNEFAKSIGISNKSLYNYLTCKMPMPDKILKRMAQELDCSVDDLKKDDGCTYGQEAMRLEESKNLSNLIKNKKWTNETLANKLNVSTELVDKWTSAEEYIPSNYIAQIMKELNCSLKEIRGNPSKVYNGHWRY